MNLVTQMGRFTADPEVRYTQDNKAIARFSLAVNRRFKQEGQPDADFFSYVAFGKTAEFIQKYFHKGMKAVITGELRNNHYTDQQGVKHYTEQIVISTIEFAESKTSGQSTPPPTPENGDDGFINIPEGIEDDLPFN